MDGETAVDFAVLGLSRVLYFDFLSDWVFYLYMTPYARFVYHLYSKAFIEGLLL